MRRTSTCICGLLEWHARNAGAVTREAGGGYALRLTSRRCVPIAACWFCGGYQQEERGLFLGGGGGPRGAPCASAAGLFFPGLFRRAVKQDFPTGAGAFHHTAS